MDENQIKTLKQLNKETRVFRKMSLNKRLLGIETDIKKSHEEERLQNELRASTNIKNNSKYFFSYAAKFSAKKTQIGPFISDDGDIIDNEEKMCELLSEQYCSAFSIPSKTIGLKVGKTATQIEDIEITERCILNAIDELSSISSAGPDEIPAFIVKKCKMSLAFPLMILWKKS